MIHVACVDLHRLSPVVHICFWIVASFSLYRINEYGHLITVMCEVSELLHRMIGVQGGVCVSIKITKFGSYLVCVIDPVGTE